MRKKFILTIAMFAIAIFCAPTIHGGSKALASFEGEENFDAVYIDSPTFYFNLHVESDNDGECAFAELKWTNANGVVKNPHLNCCGDRCNKTTEDGPRNGYVTLQLHTKAHGYYGYTAAIVTVTW